MALGELRPHQRPPDLHRRHGDGAWRVHALPLVREGARYPWDILEEETGARLTHSFGRVGGMAKPPSPDFKGMAGAALPRILALKEEGEKMLLKNRIFIDRLQNKVPISGREVGRSAF